MTSVYDLSPDTLLVTDNLLPVIRGGLSRSGDADGRPFRVRVNFGVTSPAPPDTDCSPDNATDIISAFTDGATVISLGDLGFLTLDSSPSDEREFSGQVAVITGGASGLGYCIASELSSRGAAVALLDVSESEVMSSASCLGGIGFVCDVTDSLAVEDSISRIVSHYGGIDVLISNAGVAYSGFLLDLDDADFARSFGINFWGHHYVSRSVVRVMRRQGTGGSLVFNVSKQSVNPGPGFGAYGASKAALMALMRQYAVEHGSDGITSNAVNADRIRSGLLTDEMVLERSDARGLTPDEYMSGNLLGREVTGKDVAEAFVHLARARVSTGSVLTVDGGNVAAMMR